MVDVQNGTKKGRVNQARELFRFAFFFYYFYYNAKSVSFQVAKILPKGTENNKLYNEFQMQKKQQHILKLILDA